MNQKPTGKTPERYPTCGARTRKGTPCRLLAGYKTGNPGRGRCKLHGGESSGAPVGNKNAVTTGAYESIVFDRLPDTERELYGRIDPSPRAQAEEEIRLLTIRECRMLARIQDLLASREELGTVETTTEAGRRARGEVDVATVRSEATLERVQRVEEALTRIQQRKGYFVEILRRIEAAVEPQDLTGTALSGLIEAIERSGGGEE
ncbi:MAG: hypothetical protein M3246_02265 [Actinomycetota bacterium]|nr:hypothetical protein [Actinomycetota bacterium]